MLSDSKNSALSSSGNSFSKTRRQFQIDGSSSTCLANVRSKLHSFCSSSVKFNCINVMCLIRGTKACRIPRAFLEAFFPANANSMEQRFQQSSKQAMTNVSKSALSEVQARATNIKRRWMPTVLSMSSFTPGNSRSNCASCNANNSISRLDLVRWQKVLLFEDSDNSHRSVC